MTCNKSCTCKDFGCAFEEATHVIIPGIYKVRDSLEDIEAVNGEVLVEEIQKHHASVEYCEGDEKVLERIRELVGPDSVLVVMGGADRLVV